MPSRSRKNAAGSPDEHKPPEASSASGARSETTWKLRYSSRILERDLGDIGPSALDAAKTACEKKLASNPEQFGEPLHHPLHGLRKLRAGHLRIAYHVEVGAHEVWVLMIGDRRDIWDHSQGEILDRGKLERAAHTARQSAAKVESARSGKAKKPKRG